jgi:hypothetical protein
MFITQNVHMYTVSTSTVSLFIAIKPEATENCCMQLASFLFDILQKCCLNNKINFSKLC